jgi:hypothetical protein
VLASAYSAANLAVVALGGDLVPSFSGKGGAVATAFPAQTAAHSGLKAVVRVPTSGETPIVSSSTTTTTATSGEAVAALSRRAQALSDALAAAAIASRRAAVSGSDSFEMRLADSQALSVLAARFRGRLVYVVEAQAVPDGTVAEGTAMTVTLKGSHLTDPHVSYALSPQADCQTLLSARYPVAAAANAFGDEVLSYRSPAGTYYICYSVRGQNATTGSGVGPANGFSAILLGQRKFNNATSVDGGSSGDGLLIAAIIGGISLLALICCIVFLWRRCGDQKSKRGEKKSKKDKTASSSNRHHGQHHHHHHDSNAGLGSPQTPRGALRVEDADNVAWQQTQTPPGAHRHSAAAAAAAAAGRDADEIQQHFMTSRGNTPQVVTGSPVAALTRDNLAHQQQHHQHQRSRGHNDGSEYESPIRVSNFASPIQQHRQGGGGGSGSGNNNGNCGVPNVVRVLDPMQQLRVDDVNEFSPRINRQPSSQQQQQQQQAAAAADEEEEPRFTTTCWCARTADSDSSSIPCAPIPTTPTRCF